MFNTRRSIFLVAVLALLLGTAFAQDAGQYVILNAQYGNDRNHVDVTARLQELARRDRPFRISDESMAVDPDRGHAKMLRVFARGSNGQERVFDFPDGSGFDGAQFRSFTRADWGDNTWSGGWSGRTDNYAGQYVILSAQYGSETRHVDVTNRLKEMVRQNRAFRLNYETFGVDPAEGQAKVLRIYAQTPNGQEQMFEYRDNSLIDGAVFQGWNNGQWGNGRWSGNWNGGGYPGGGNNAGGDAGQYLILTAQYGNEYHHVDVTNRLKEMARADARFRLNYATFGVDPAEGQAKSLRIFAQGPNGQEQMFEYRDNSIIDGAQFRGWNNGQWGTTSWSGNWNGGGYPGGNNAGGDAGQYLILTAQYGNEYHHVDVTNRLKEMARADRQFRLNYETFGVDPAEGQAKSLRIFAEGPNGQEQMFEYRDNSIIDGAQFRGWSNGQWSNRRWSGNWNPLANPAANRGDQGQFVILSAQYGSQRRHVDVTNRLKELARTDQQYRLDFRTFGVDPDRGHSKVLRIFARGPNGRERMFEYRDGSVIDGAQFRGWGRGEWGNNANDRWSGRWDGEERHDRGREHDRD